MSVSGAGSPERRGLLDAWPRRWRFFAELIAAGFFAAMFAGFMIQIISRYVLNDPVSWSLELCSIAYVWVVFWSCDILVEERQHIVFDVVYERIPKRARRAVAIFNTASLGLVFLAALPSSIDYVLFMARRYSTVMHVRMDIVYACFAIFVLSVVVAAGVRLWRLAGADWEKRI